jgi:hypothetical protein
MVVGKSPGKCREFLQTWRGKSIQRGLRGTMTAMRSLALAAVLTLLTAGPPSAAAESFHVDWQVTATPRGPVLAGYVYNRTSRAAERIRLRIDSLDPGGAVAASALVWVMGYVPIDGRGYFSTRVPPAAAYRVDVVAFDPIIDAGAGM